MVHDYSEQRTQEWEVADGGLVDTLARCPNLGPSELLFLYPQDRRSGSVSVHLQAQSLVVSVSRSSRSISKPDNLIVALWESTSIYSPVVALEGDELEIDGEVIVGSPPSMMIYPNVDLCDRAILPREREAQIDNGTLIELRRMPQ